MSNLGSIGACCEYLEARIKEMKVEEPILDLPMAALMSHFVASPGWADYDLENLLDDESEPEGDQQLVDQMDVDDNNNQNPDNEYTPPDEASDSESEGEEDDGAFDESSVCDFIRKLHPKIVGKLHARAEYHIPGLQPDKKLQVHQALAVGAALLASKSRFKGMILADSPGLGKTLTALSVIALRGGTAIVVAPPSCVTQWKQEVHRFFGNSMPCISLLAEQATPVQLHQYRIVITSYHQIAAELGRKERYLAAVVEYDAQNPGSKTRPKRPSLTILSGILEQQGAKPLARTLILDEVHMVKNTSSRMFRAIHRARQLTNFCLMMSGTPVDNTWFDLYAMFSLLYGHKINTQRRMRFTFTGEANRGKVKEPYGTFLERLIQMLDAVTLRRPVDTMEFKLPTITKITCTMKTNDGNVLVSNDKFRDYKRVAAMKRKDRNAEEDGDPLSLFIKARQYSYHLMLVLIHEVERAAQIAAIQGDENMDSVEEQHQGVVAQWYQDMRQGDCWMSARTYRIVNVVHSHLQLRPDDAIVIMDESVFFLDIVETGFQKMVDLWSVPTFRYDGRHSPAERSVVLEKFNAAQGCRVLLASRGTGGQGLNLQCANVMIRCGPWWKVAWEEQADGRISRPGQEKPTFVYEINDEGFDVDNHLKQIRDKKHRLNDQILTAVTYPIDAPDPEPRDI
ncbi:hypothetical protein ACHAPQ_007392 [Fusarium lateritium]